MAKTTITLPSFGLTDPGADKTIMWDDSASALTIAGQLGVTAVSQWRLSSSFTGDASPISSNLEEVDTDGYGSIGTDMTQSSGVFTFPSTGFWYIEFTVEASATGATAYHTGAIHTTTDNSSYGSASDCNCNFANSSGTYYGNASCRFLFDVTSTTNCKVKFVIDDAGSQTTIGNTGNTSTGMTFIRLGDT
tara:strand:- start:259 stop:831 length:573 start_codon:yes stop_codon:yes gene_type:complete